MALYNSTDGQNWTSKGSWLERNTPCSWYEVTCEDNNVTRLWLEGNQLNGPVPPEIGNPPISAGAALYILARTLHGLGIYVDTGAPDGSNAAAWAGNITA